MAITRVNSSWGVNDKLTSAQANGIDTNTTFALDKRTGQTDTLQSVVTINSTGNVVSAVSAGIQSSTAGGIQASAAASIASTAAGGFQHAGGASDYVTFSATRSIVRRMSAIGAVGLDAAHLTLQPTSQWVIGDNTAAAIYLDANRFMHNGATLASVTATFYVSGAYTSLPATYPKIGVRRRDASTGSGVSLRTAGDAFFPTPANTTAWIAGGAVQTWTYTCDQNNVIDRTAYDYLITITDASGGTGTSISNTYVGVALTFTVADMRFA